MFTAHFWQANQVLFMTQINQPKYTEHSNSELPYLAVQIDFTDKYIPRFPFTLC